MKTFSKRRKLEISNESCAKIAISTSFTQKELYFLPTKFVSLLLVLSLNWFATIQSEAFLFFLEMKEWNERRSISSTHKKKELTIPNQQQKSKFFWLSLICLWSIWSLPKLNTNRYGNCFDQFHFELQPKGEKINNLGNFFIFAEASGKSSEIWVGFAANDFVFFPL